MRCSAVGRCGRRSCTPREGAPVARSDLRSSSDRNDLAEPEYARAIELFESVGDVAEAGHLTLRIASDALGQGDVERAKQLVEGALDADRPLALHLLGRIAFARRTSRGAYALPASLPTRRKPKARPGLAA